MKHVRYAISLMVVFALTLVIAGCGDPPWVERGLAKQARRVAVAKGAETGAPAEFAKAKALYGKADEQVDKDKNGPDAKKYYTEARWAFERATWAVMTEPERQAVIDKTNKQLASLEEGWKKYEAQAGNLNADRKAAFEADAKAFKEGIKAAKDRVVADTVGAKEKTDTELKPIYDKWEIVFRPAIPLK